MVYSITQQRTRPGGSTKAGGGAAIRMKKFLLAVPLLIGGVTIAPLPGGAREMDLVSIEVRSLPFLSLEHPQTNTFEDHVKIQPQDVKARVSLPPWRLGSNGTLLSVGLGYENLRFFYKNWDSAQDPNRVDELQAAQLFFFLKKQLHAEGWGLRSFVTSGIHSDFKAITTRDLRLQGGAMLERQYARGHLWGFGLVFLNDYGTPRVFPGVYYQRTIGSAHRINVRLPTQLSYAYIPNDRWELGVAAKVTGNNSRLEREGPLKGKTVKYSLGTIGPSIKRNINRFLSVSLEGGTTFRHQLEIYDGSSRIRDLGLRQSYFVTTAVRAGF